MLERRSAPGALRAGLKASDIIDITTLSFEDFWTWLQGHANCILRVATPESVLYDDDDLHWWVGVENGFHIAQVIRGKRLCGEVLIDPERVTYVQSMGETEGEFAFELIAESETDRVAAFQFSMAHGFDDDEDRAHGPAIH